MNGFQGQAIVLGGKLLLQVLVVFGLSYAGQSSGKGNLLLAFGPWLVVLVLAAYALAMCRPLVWFLVARNESLTIDGDLLSYRAPTGKVVTANLESVKFLGKKSFWGQLKVSIFRFTVTDSKTNSAANIRVFGNISAAKELLPLLGVDSWLPADQGKFT